MRNFLQGVLDRVFPAPKIELDPKQVAEDKLKDTLYEEYGLLVEITNKLTATQKYELAKLTQMPEWKTFSFVIDRYKALIFNKGTKHGETKDDLLVMKAQCRNATVFGSFWRKYKNMNIPTGALTPDNPATTISLD